MTQKEAKILVEIITKVVRKELGTFKRQLLQEGYAPPTTSRPQQQYAPQPTNKLTEVHKNFRKSFKSSPSPTRSRPLSRDPLLNSLLQSTISIEEAEAQAEQAALLENINLPVDANGRVISSNANVDHVLEAMNRDYSGMFKPKGSAPTSAPAQAKSQLRSDFLAAMEDDIPMPRGTTSPYPSVQPFSGEEEDMTWLNEVA